MNGSARWSVVVLVVLVALGVAFWRELGEPEPTSGARAVETSRDHRDADTPEALAGPRARADLAPCPGAGPGPGPEALRGTTLECAGDGSPVDVGRAVDGRAVVLNLWAYWCGPCADELPAMAEYQRRMGSAVTVLTVHQDENETAALVRLAELGVHLPTLQDGRRLVAAALRVPNVMPATVVLRSDGTVADILPRSFATADEIAEAVNPRIGVPG
ncbi:TlpA family protein disulfide reductase [Mycolicibacterium sediminis]|uniref:Membrane protein n=1 Tax=Mycolicibacterium sediminis TaxID=1286180 RepID=A0A7I7QJ45_9MYCO|nr:TlpA disulfide reductase family protein [Mycolicibacterium sediminis]BBY26272.1 membrane protein [Mycolicibacterium sediminis]